MEWFVGETQRAKAYADVNAALEPHIDTMFENFDARVSDRVTESVNEVIGAVVDRANTTTSSNLSKQVKDLKTGVGLLRGQLAEVIKTHKNNGGKKNDTSNNTNDKG